MAIARKLKEKNTLHIEAEGCIINIREGLTDITGRKVTSVSIIPDNYTGEKKWIVIPKVSNVRIVQLKK